LILSIRKIVLSALIATVAFAQAPASPPAENALPSDPEKVKRSAESVAQMRSTLKDVLGKLEEARSTKDVVKLNCVNEKLTQVKGLLRISEASDVQLQEAVAKNESSVAEHEYTKINLASSRVEQLRAEAEQCIGQLAFRIDENMSVEVEVPEYLPPGDPTIIRTGPPAVLRPPPASPT
jgi:hypothetical protein